MAAEPLASLTWNGTWADLRGTLVGARSLPYWLLLAPALIVFFYQVGRGLGNTGYVLYWLAAVALLLRHRSFCFPVAASILFVALLAWGTLSAALSVDALSAYRQWAQYALLGSCYFITWRLVRLIPDFSLDRALKIVGAVGFLSFAIYAGRYLVLSGSPGFQPETQVHGLVPAYLAPFTLYLLWRVLPEKRALMLGLAYLISLALLLVFSNSLTEVLALTAVLGVLAFFFVPDKRVLVLSLGAVALLFASLILLFDPAGSVLTQAQGAQGGNWFAVLDELSSYRASIWHKALTIPPPNPWLGVGPGNVSLYPPVVIDAVGKVGHLHNLFLDAWYELGFVGLAMYVAFYAAQVQAMRSGAAALSSGQRGVMWATVAGIFVASMLEQSHRSHHVAMFLPFLFALYSRGSAAEPHR